MSGAGKGDLELVIAVVGFLITAALLVITLVTARIGRGGAGRWFTGCAAAFVATVGLLSFV
ncbi:hypothetical protein LQ327_31410 [Actinomycetospora endophytica]|uniref:Uncharacterized protein n=1 Tax=Actinomycetospora endophytica TaxID=2291215 RepID=A0ABS8PIY9_9PSEU|nr:hypothetical protein [Actinomycetospora endophytica]MCD2197887.1 hypothetical protein [Actinomycetospora endophytica]